MKLHGPYLILLIIGVSFLSCNNPGEKKPGDPDKKGIIGKVSFDGADYSTDAEKVLHGERLADLFACNACHLPDYSGTNFGDIVPLLKDLWATNISLTMTEMTDEEIERILREGIHPDRDMFLMPSKQTQFLSERDMRALIAYLRTIPPTGSPTPAPPEGFRDSVSARLPADYWRKDEKGKPYYHTSEDEVLYYRDHALPDLGEDYAKGRLIAQTMCTSCHGAALDGVGEMSGDIQRADEYDVVTFKRLLMEGITSQGKAIEFPFTPNHVPASLTSDEIQAVIAYTMELVKPGPEAK